MPVLSLDLASTSHSVHITWTSSSTPTSFQLWRNRNSAGYALFQTVTGATLTYTDTSNLTFGGFNSYKVSADGGVTFSNEISISNNFSWPGTGAIVSYPTLIMDVGILTFDGDGVTPMMTSLNLPLLVKAVKGLQVEENPSLTSINIPSFSYSGDSLYFAGNPILPNLDLSALTTALTDIRTFVMFGGDVALKHITFNSSLRLSHGYTFDFSGCALDAATVALILRIAAESSFQSGDTLKLSGGTNSPPVGAQAIGDKAAITIAGCAVTTN